MRYLLNNIQNDDILFGVEFQMEFFREVIGYQLHFHFIYINLQVFDLFHLRYLD
jgi:hypothetical protein